MNITLSANARGTGWLDGRCTWRLPAARAFGSLSVEIPSDSHLHHEDYVLEQGGTLVEVRHPTLGLWRGVASAPESDPTTGALRLEAVELGGLAEHHPVASNRRFRGLTAGAIVRAGFGDAFGGLGGFLLTRGAFCEAAPVLDEYQFTGQPFSAVLGDLAEQTGQEWVIDDDGLFHWQPPRGALYSLWLAENGDIVEVVRDGNVQDRATEVVAIGSDGRSHPEMADDALDTGWWRRSVPISVSTTNSLKLALAAKAELMRLRWPAITYRGFLAEAHWAIREGDSVRLFLPEKGAGGEAVTCRVVSRTWASNSPYLEVEMVWQRVTGAIGGRVEPGVVLNRGDAGRQLVDRGFGGWVSVGSVSAVAG